jgi:hypothetical protein
MSYDIYLKDPVTKHTIEVENYHDMMGGTYCLDGTKELWLNVTYNYSKHFYNVVDKKDGIRAIYGMSGAQSIPILKSAIAKLKDDVNEDYWKPTEGNAKRSLIQLLAMAEMRPDGIWDGD